MLRAFEEDVWSVEKDIVSARQCDQRSQRASIMDSALTRDARVTFPVHSPRGSAMIDKQRGENETESTVDEDAKPAGRCTNQQSAEERTD